MALADQQRKVRIRRIKEVLSQVAREYPANLIEGQIRDIPRIAFNIVLAVGNRDPSGLRVCDIGGGIGLFSIGCAALGFKKVVLVDDFRDSINLELGDSILQLHQHYNVRVVSIDVVRDGLRGVEGDLDVITSFDSMEHWHHSPKRLFHQAMDLLAPQGLFVLGVPNCVNMRKRITVPLGIGKWSSLEDWYETDVFRGHVREPDASDLKYIAEDLALKNVRLVGRNWAGYRSSRRMIRYATVVMDYPLRLVPSLCSDLYMTGEKAGTGSGCA